MIVVSDTSPINALQRIGQLDLLPVIFGRVVIPPSVRTELQNAVKHGLDLNVIDQAEWLEVHPISNQTKIVEFQEKLELGESEAIALSLELHADFLLIDEKEGRAIASQEGIQVIGVLGILIRAKKIGLIDAIAPLLELLVNHVGFWIAENTRERILRMAGEF